MDIINKATDIQAAEGNRPIGQRTENTKPDPTTEISLSDSPLWTLAQIVGKKRLIATRDIAVSDTGVMYQFVNTVANTLALFPSPVISDMFGFIRYEIVFDLEIQSHFQHQGALVAMNLPLAIPDLWWPFNSIATNTNATISNSSATKLPHDFVSFGHNGNYRIRLPWTTNQNMISMRTQSNANSTLNLRPLNCLRIQAFDPLNAIATAVGTSTLRIWANLENIDYSGYLPRY